MMSIEDLRESLPTIVTPAGTIRCAYCKCDMDLELYLSAMIEYAKTAVDTIIKREEIQDSNFRGNDWYFFDGYEGDDLTPPEWYVQTLSEKRQNLREFCELSEGTRKYWEETHDSRRV